jgi:hypothetical protein
VASCRAKIEGLLHTIIEREGRMQQLESLWTS